MCVRSWWFGFVCLVIPLGGTCGAAPPESSSPGIDWPGDLAVLRRELPARHRNLFFSVDRATWDRELDALQGDLHGLDDLGVAMRLQRVVIAMGDDHSGVDWRRFERSADAAPLGIHWFADGWRLLGTTKAHGTLLGARVVAVGGVPMDEVERRAGALMSRDNLWLVRSRLPNVLPLASVLRELGLTGTDGIVVTTENVGGARLDTVLEFYSARAAEGQPRVQFTPRGIPFAMSPGFRRQNLHALVLPGDRLFYIQYNRCEGRETAERQGDAAGAARLPSLEEGFHAVSARLRAALAAGEAERVVFDVQFNGGGASDFGTRFAEDLAKIEALHERGRVFVIVGRRTFSSAIINARDFQRVLGAVMVGEPTSGTPNHYGQVGSFVLPASGLRVSYSTKYFGERGAPLEPLIPDVPAIMTFADYVAGTDPALEAVRRYAMPELQTE